MPASIISIGNGRYRVETPNGVHAKNTSLENAKKQQRLINAVEYNAKFKPKRK